VRGLLVHLDDVLDVPRGEVENVITVDDDTARNARAALDRMLALP
jgi:quinolinate synthase